MHLNIAEPSDSLFTRRHLPLAATPAGAATVVCLHSSTGSHAQWRELAETLAPRWQVLSPDLHGHGRSPAWPAHSRSTLRVDAAAVVQCCGPLPNGVHLVGHSYGAAVAMQIALRYPQWVRSLTLYEPVVFGTIARMAPGDAALAEIRGVAASVADDVTRGDLTAASRRFIDYWGQAGAWAAMTPAQQAAVRSRIATVVRHFDALFAAAWGPGALSRLRMPVLLLHGASTRAPARRVVELLSSVLPRAQPCELSGAGHLGPITHAEMVNHCMATHIDPVLAAGTIRGFHVPHAINDFDSSADSGSRRADPGRLRAAA